MTKILLVDDDLVVLATVSMGLRQAGYEVVQVDTAVAALPLVEREQPDLVLLDIRMPGMDGIQLAKMLQSRFSVPVLFLTAFSNDDMVRAAGEAGALGYLVKPLEIARIVPAIETALVRAQEIAGMKSAITNLNEALDRDRDIDVAVGLLMERYRVPRRQAFESMRAYARSQSCKVGLIAKRVIDGESLKLDLDNSKPLN